MISLNTKQARTTNLYKSVSKLKEDGQAIALSTCLGSTQVEHSTKIMDFFQRIYRNIKQYIILKFRAKVNNFFVSAAKKPHRVLKNKRRYTNELLSKKNRTLGNYLAQFQAESKHSVAFFYNLQKLFLYYYSNLRSITQIEPTAVIKYENEWHKSRISLRFWWKPTMPVYWRAMHPAVESSKWQRLLRRFRYKKYRLFRYIRQRVFFNRQTIPHVIKTVYRFITNFQQRKGIQFLSAVSRPQSIIVNSEATATLNLNQLFLDEKIGAQSDFNYMRVSNSIYVKAPKVKVDDLFISSELHTRFSLKSRLFTSFPRHISDIYIRSVVYTWFKNTGYGHLAGKLGF